MLIQDFIYETGMSKRVLKTEVIFMRQFIIIIYILYTLFFYCYFKLWKKINILWKNLCNN